MSLHHCPVVHPLIRQSSKQQGSSAGSPGIQSYQALRLSTAALADPAAPPAVDDLIASLEEQLHGSRDAARRLRQELAAAAQLLPRLC